MTPHSIPWQVAVVSKIKCKTVRCGGSLINSRNVISAAHCVIDSKSPTCCYEACEMKPFETTTKQCKKCLDENIIWQTPDKLAVILGQHQASCGAYCRFENIKTDGTNATVCSISVHPSITNIREFLSAHYSPDALDNDFVILWLTNKITFDDKISPVCLPTPNMGNEYLVGKVLTASGWGTGSTKNGKYVLKAAKLFGVSNEICAKPNLVETPYPSPNLSKNMLCAGHPDQERSVCPGDSGGMFRRTKSICAKCVLSNAQFNYNRVSYILQN